MAPSGRELLRNSAPPAAASAEIRPIRLGGAVQSPFIRERRQAGLFKRVLANRRPELHQGDARASGAMRVASQRAPVRFMMPAPTHIRPPFLSRLPLAVKASPSRIAHSSIESSPR